MKKSTWIVLLVFVSAASALTVKAQTTNTSVRYGLKPDSLFQQGCFAPCECPIMIGVPVKGTFLLTLKGFNSLFTTYAVADVNWSFDLDNQTQVVTGSGTYKIGGEFALQQELSLDLQRNGGPLAHFDSGLITGPAPFPDIQVAISTNSMFCWDTVFYVSASPVTVSSVSVALTSSNMVVLSWPASAVPCVLQQSTDLKTWTTVTNGPTITGQQNQVVVPRSSAASKFYKLVPSGN